MAGKVYLLFGSFVVVIQGCSLVSESVQAPTQTANITVNKQGNYAATPGNLSFSIPSGFYDGTETISTSDPNLLATHIASGVSIFGVTGTAGLAFAACSDDAFNAAQCSTALNRYVTPTLGTAISGANGSLSATVPVGFYDGTTSCSMSDSDLVASNVKNGVNLFGVTGTAITLSGTTVSPAGAGNILSGMEAWDATGTKITGSMANRGGLNAANSFPGAGYYDGSVSNAPVSSQIALGSTVLGVSGNYTGTFALNAASNAARNPGISFLPYLTAQSTSLQMTLNTETGSYAGADLPTSGGYLYRDVPDLTRDDEGFDGTNCSYASRPVVNCGTTQSTIAARIADCAAQNPAASSWDGAIRCNGGQGTWKLVTRANANKEVWQDQRTGLLWSSLVSNSSNWCKASGSTQGSILAFYKAYNTSLGSPMFGNGTLSALAAGTSSLAESVVITFTNATTFTVASSSGASGCAGGAISSGGLTATAGSSVTWQRANHCSFTLTQGSAQFFAGDKFVLNLTPESLSCRPGGTSGYQFATPISYCAESAGLSPAGGETWTVGGYVQSKGTMGKNSTPSVRWRLPTANDYRQAEINGIRMVMPDMGQTGAARPVIDTSMGGSSVEWSGTAYSTDRNGAWTYGSLTGESTYYAFGGSYSVRCVGR